MKRISLLLLVFALFGSYSDSDAQVTSLVCNDLVYVNLTQNCTYTMDPFDMLEGGPYGPANNYLVEVDKTPPYGNGPWVTPTFGPSDLNKTYQARVSDVTTGNKCWGNVKILDTNPATLNCTGLTTVSLGAGGVATLSASSLQVTIADNCTAGNNLTVKFAGGQTSTDFTCSNLGPNLLTLQVTDASNNTATCQTTVLVEDPSSFCNACVTCPPNVTVTFLDAFTNLVPAWNAGNAGSLFDSYGEATFSAACTHQDSTYSASYHPAPSGQSWFLRHWEEHNGSGQVVGACDQAIIFPSSQTITVQGTVFVDTLANCQFDTGEQTLSKMSVTATKYPGLETITVTTDSSGHYSLSIPFNGLDSIADVQVQLPNNISTACVTDLVVFAHSTTPTQTQDFGLQGDGICYKMEVGLEGLTMRRCTNNAFYINYCNYGPITAPGAYAEVHFDSLLQVQSSQIPWTTVQNNTYTFPLGDIPAWTCKSFYVFAYLSCDAQLDHTICSDVTIYPNTPCNGGWNGPKITTKGYCDGDSVRLQIQNIGIGNMVAPLGFIVIEDVIMYKQGDFQLASGDSLAMSMPANGATWRIEAQQAPAYPIRTHPSSTVEGCGGLNQPGLVNAFPPADDPLYLDTYCEQVTGSYDPNDKTAVPTGYAADHIIPKNTDIEYRIRFQNTGSDTAFRVVVVDTLSNSLDPTTLEAGPASHPYRLQVFAGGILHFVFDPIALPDTNKNELASHGFVSFRISQKKDLADGTRIKNTASIYFDGNKPVQTNTTFHTIGKPYVASGVFSPFEKTLLLEMKPNPMHDWSVLQLSGETVRDGLLTLYDSRGAVVLTQEFQGAQCRLSGQTLKPGLYFFRVNDGGVLKGVGKVIVD